MLKKIINKFTGWALHRKRGLSTSFKLQQLENIDDADIRNIAAAINFVNRKSIWSDIEQTAFRRIEKIRRSYLATNDTIKITDYGAGNSDDKRTQEQMNKGVSEMVSVSAVCKSSSSPEKWGKLIFKLIRNLHPSNCLELGTCMGISAAYQVSALKLNGHNGKFISIEGDKELARFSKLTLKSLEYPECTVLQGRFKDVLSSLLPESQPFDFVFIDGHHDKVATREYFNLIHPYLAKKSVVIFDDINWSKGMQEVWAEINQDQRIKMSFDLYKWGICLIDKTALVDRVECYKLVI